MPVLRIVRNSHLHFVGRMILIGKEQTVLAMFTLYFKEPKSVLWISVK